MNVEGNHDFNISSTLLWSYLMDPEVLAKITPGVTRLETIEADHYKSVSDIKIGPVKGSFAGKLKVINKNEPASFDIEMEQLSKIGNAHATVHMNIENKGDQLCALVFNGRAKLSGVIARTGQRVLSGVANTLTKEVFAALEEHIAENATAIPAAAAPTPIVIESNETIYNAPPIIKEDKISTSKTTEQINTTADTNQRMGLIVRLIQFFRNLFRSNS